MRNKLHNNYSTYVAERDTRRSNLELTERLRHRLIRSSLRPKCKNGKWNRRPDAGTAEPRPLRQDDPATKAALITFILL